MSFRVGPDAEVFRVKAGQFRTEPGDQFGLFYVRVRGVIIKVIASDGGGWEHVSVSLTNRCPTWAEMCAIKDLFWDFDDTVVQFHPRQSEYVNNHPNCLHLWRRAGEEYDLPPSIFVGLKGVTPQDLQEALR
jgi:hypothetical protein